MNKLLSIILSYLLICSIFIYDHMFPYKDLIIIGIIILFPIIFIFQGIIKATSIKHLIIRFLLSSTIILIFFKEWYLISDTLNLIVIYMLLGLTSFIIKNIFTYIKYKNKWLP